MAADITDLPFDPVRVRLKIHELRKNLLGLETLLQTYGLDVDGPQRGTAVPPLIESSSRRRTRRSKLPYGIRRTVSRASAKAKKPKLADLGVAVIAKHGGKAHGKLIVAELKQDGHMQGVAHPDSNISTALSRDKRVKRVEGERNMWVLTGAA